MKKLLFIGLLLLVTGCFSQKPKLPIEENKTLVITGYTIILDGYKDGEERREFQELLKGLGLQVENLNAGGSHAEYALTPPEGKSDWLKLLVAKFADKYTFKQEGERLIFIHK